MSFVPARSAISRLLADYGMLGVLGLLCLYYSWATLKEQHPRGEDGGRKLAAQIVRGVDPVARILVVARGHAEDLAFTAALRERLTSVGRSVIEAVNEEPPGVRKALARLTEQGRAAEVIATTSDYGRIAANIARDFPTLAKAEVVEPDGYYWPTFLLAGNLLNVANQIVVIAVIAVGMTMVIITGGIDLSVGSLVALSAVVTGTLIVRAGGLEASPAGMTAAAAGAIAVCAGVGAFSGLMIALFRVPPFIATLAMMQVASGLAYIISHGGSIYQIPVSFTWLGRGTTLLSIPHAVILMAAIYAAAHFVMARTTLGRYIYAVGGNRQAARLSGLRVNRVLLVVYVASGAMAGLGGVIEASQLKAGGPTYGLMYELYVIAAVVVGGTSLSGGEGRILGTLIGAFIIAVIQNGMNLTEVESYTQKVVLGLVILGAVLLDMLKRQGWRGLLRSE